MKPLVLCLGICGFILLGTAQAQWQQRALGGTNVHSLLTNGALTYCGTDTSGFYLSTNDGVSWTQRNNGLTSRFVRTFAASGSNLFAGTNGPAGTYLTTDNGGSWSIVNSGLTNTAVHALAFNGTTLFAGSNGGGVFRSTNNGASWSASNNGLTNNSVHALLAVGGRVFAGTGSISTEGGVFISADDGATWSRPATSPNNIRAITTSGGNIFAATNGAGVFRSTDNGTSWAAANNGLLTQMVRALISHTGALFAGTNGGGIYLSTNSGANWSQINTGLTNLSVLCLATNSTTLYAGMQTGGVWTRPLSQVVAVEEPGSAMPTTYILEQNYPNPFNPGTTIGFRIHEKGFVSLKVYSVLGSEIATLVHEEKQPGAYFSEWNAEGHSSGVYVYQLVAGGSSTQRRMLLLK